MIAVVDYGVGNLFSLCSSLRHTADPAVIRAADRVILPGVGAFGDAMEKLAAAGLVPVIRAEAEKKPLLGICLGMQLLFDKSWEFGEHAGLGLVPGQVCPLAPDLADKGSMSITSTATTPKTAPQTPWPSATTPSRSPGWCGRAGSTAPSSTPKRAGTPGCGS